MPAGPVLTDGETQVIRSSNRKNPAPVRALISPDRRNHPHHTRTAAPHLGLEAELAGAGGTAPFFGLVAPAAAPAAEGDGRIGQDGAGPDLDAAAARHRPVMWKRGL